MLGFLPGPLLAAVFLTLLVASTVVFSLLIIVLMPLRFLMPTLGLRAGITRVLIGLAVLWCQVNNRVLIKLLPPIDWDISLPPGLSRDKWYFVVSNHQSWVDIMVLFYVFTGRIPFLKYFLKQELLYVPFWGQAMYALDYPFMKRYSKETLARHPELKGKDVETTRRSCEKFHYTPVSVANFLEGTRCTPEKQAAQRSPYRHLLRPKAGGMAFTLYALGAQMHALLDVTIVYPGGNPTFMDFASGRVRRVVVRVHKREIPAEAFTHNYETDAAFRERFQQWTAALWQDKDSEITRLLQGEKNRC